MLAEILDQTDFDSVTIAAHAQSSPQPSETACNGSEQVRVFDNSGVLDDQFDVFVDGQLLFRTPVGGEAVNNTCASGIGSGAHTLRIQFVQDIDDPGGTDAGQSGTYGIALANGVTFLSGPGVLGPTSASGDLFPPGSFDDYQISVP